MPLSPINGYNLSKNNLAEVTFKACIEILKSCIKSSKYQIIICEKSSNDQKVHFALKCVLSIGWVTFLSLVTQSWPWYNLLNSKKHSDSGQELISSPLYHYLIISWNLCYTLFSWLIKWYIFNIIKSKDKRYTFCYPVMALILKTASKKGPIKSK